MTLARLAASAARVRAGQIAVMGARKHLAVIASACMLLAACDASGVTPTPVAGSTGVAPGETRPSATETSGPSAASAPDQVRLQLQWVPQAQFAGYYAAVEQGYYDSAGIKLTIVPGGPDIIPQAAGSAADGPEFTISWVPKVLQARIGDPASDLVDIAQVFQRSGTLSVSWKDSNITAPADFEGKKVGVWDFGNEFEVTAGALNAGLTQGTNYEKVIQPFDMSLLLSKQIDVAEAMIYNEYAQLLEAKDHATGALVQPTAFNVINWSDEGTAMLQDAIFARASWLALPGKEDVAVRFLKASFQGWIYCRTNPADCVQYTLKNGSTLGAGHQAWQLNEINALIWPSPNGIGIMDPALWQQTVGVSLEAGIIKEAPPADAYRTDLAQTALTEITDDTKGADFVKGVVEVTVGGN
jgi:NitT/TauT family transport system substrate-binding protein